MQLKDKITVDLLEFIKSGKFDYLKLGNTKEWIINNFPDPDNFNDSSKVYGNPIWWYGNIELHFNDDELCLIHSDNIDSLDGGKNLNLKKWIFDDFKKLTLLFFIQQLNQECIDFKVEHKTYSDLLSVNITILKSNVKLGFGPSEKQVEELPEFLDRNQNRETNLFKLQGFSLTQD